MLEKYEVSLSGTIQDIDKLVYAIESMHNMRDGYYGAYGLKDELKGVRKNWFPLVLLSLFQIMDNNNLNKQVIKVVKTFATGMNTRSFYLDSYNCMGFGAHPEVNGGLETIHIIFRAKNEMIVFFRELIPLFNLSPHFTVRPAPKSNIFFSESYEPRHYSLK